jgi:hydrogenase expression/formation protein HypD
VDEYRSRRVAETLAREIVAAARHRWVVMEICGGQTHTILRYGLDELIGGNVELVHGPGCPVCITPAEAIDQAIALALTPGVILTSYGDMLRVPGSRTNLFQARAEGADVRVVYSPVEAVKLSREYPDRQVVFFAIGFETTAPGNAMAAVEARRQGRQNFSLLVSQALVPPAIRALMRSPENRVQGLIAPGHVCTVMGCGEYAALAAECRIPVVVAGFEPADLLQAVLMLVRQLEAGKAELENQYARSVRAEGNPAARRIMEEVFERCDQTWRGVGEIPESGLRLRAAYAAWDARQRFRLAAPLTAPERECMSAQILQGRKLPTDCPWFGGRCLPESPLGAPMVSSEGACAAYYRYRGHAARTEARS